MGGVRVSVMGCECLSVCVGEHRGAWGVCMGVRGVRVSVGQGAGHQMHEGQPWGALGVSGVGGVGAGCQWGKGGVGGAWQYVGRGLRV